MIRNIPFSPPDISDKEIRIVKEALESGWITTGPKTKEFENKISQYCGGTSKKAVCLNSATACMEMVLRLFDIGEGDEVITSAYTYTASASVIEHVGAKIVLVDTQKDSYHMNYDILSDVITEKTKAIISVDIGGVMCNYNKIFEIVNAKRNMFTPSSKYQEALGRILVLADSAHGFGASYHNIMSGRVADFTSFSFHAVKNLTTAEGGALTWNTLDGISDNEIYNRFMLLSLHGQSKDAFAKTKLGAWEYDIISTSYKCNMTDVSAAIGLGQLERYEELLNKRRALIEQYNDGIDSRYMEFLVHFADEYQSSGHLYLTRLVGRDSDFRNEFITKIAEKGVSCNVHYKPLPMHTAYKKLGFNILDYPNAYKQYENEVTLPLNTKMSCDDVEYVIRITNEILRNGI